MATAPTLEENVRNGTCSQNELTARNTWIHADAVQLRDDARREYETVKTFDEQATREVNALYRDHAWMTLQTFERVVMAIAIASMLLAACETIWIGIGDAPLALKTRVAASAFTGVICAFLGTCVFMCATNGRIDYSSRHVGPIRDRHQVLTSAGFYSRPGHFTWHLTRLLLILFTVVYACVALLGLVLVDSGTACGCVVAGVMACSLACACYYGN
jgi:hypothetical protein